MSSQMYEDRWNYRDSEGGYVEFSHVTVVPVQVLSDGVEDNDESIRAIDADGQVFLGRKGEYHKTEAEAWLAVVSALEADIQERKHKLKRTQRAIDVREAFLSNLKARLGQL